MNSVNIIVAKDTTIFVETQSSKRYTIKHREGDKVFSITDENNSCITINIDVWETIHSTIKKEILKK